MNWDEHQTAEFRERYGHLTIHQLKAELKRTNLAPAEIDGLSFMLGEREAEEAAAKSQTEKERHEEKTQLDSDRNIISRNGVTVAIVVGAIALFALLLRACGNGQ